MICGRIQFNYLLISSPVSDNRASLLRSTVTPKKNPLEGQRGSLTHLWKNLVAMAMRVVPPIPSVAVRCASPDLSIRYVVRYPLYRDSFHHDPAPHSLLPSYLHFDF